MPPVMGAIDDHEAPGCRQRDGENQTDDPHESSHRAPPFCRVRRPGRGSIPQSEEKRGAIPQAGGGARGRGDSRRSPPEPVRRGAIERKEKRGAIPQAGGGARGRSDSRRSPPDPIRRGQMSKSVRPVPEGHPTVSPYLIVSDGAVALDFYKKAFGATELMRHTDPNGRVGHAEIMIGESVIMLADEFPDFG